MKPNIDEDGNYLLCEGDHLSREADPLSREKVLLDEMFLITSGF
ncbi:MAG TPA: hypothetical protein VHD35_14440 [Chitinophagaceae bacterium]|nr:hypothetical protein [Chitinophagaceae bacterium]